MAKPTSAARIVTAAEELFATQGFHQTQISDIVKRAGVSNGTFYKYFGAKVDVLESMLVSFATELRSALNAERSSISQQNPLERFITVHNSFRCFFSRVFERPKMARILFGIGYGTGPEVERLVRDFVQGFCGDIVDDLVRTDENELTAVPDKDIIAHALAGVAFQVGDYMVHNNDLDVDRAVRACASFAGAGLSLFASDKNFDEVLPALRALMQPTVYNG